MTQTIICADKTLCDFVRVHLYFVMLLYHWRFHARNQVTFLEESGLQVFTQLTTVFKFYFCSCCRFISCITRMTLYFNTTIPDPLQHATPYSSLPTTTSQILPWLSMSPDLNPNKHAWNELETSLRQNEHPCKHAWIVSGTRAGVGGHPKASALQPDPVHAWEMLGS